MGQQIIENVKIYIDNQLLPTGSSNRTPLITWVLPENIKQQCFDVQLKSIKSGSYMRSGINGGYRFGNNHDRSFLWPSGNSMNDTWKGLCSVQITISEKVYSE